mmetsp:Transcript_19774/g.29166  ORF Transcript_19774/g.29166 Transcript_19774/m.29166 type:complete len:295 (+) Transcript_19774:22-906(+)
MPLAILLVLKGAALLLFPARHRMSCFCMCRWIGVISKRFYASFSHTRYSFYMEGIKTSCLTNCAFSTLCATLHLTLTEEHDAIVIYSFKTPIKSKLEFFQKKYLCSKLLLCRLLLLQFLKSSGRQEFIHVFRALLSYTSNFRLFASTQTLGIINRDFKIEILDSSAYLLVSIPCIRIFFYVICLGQFIQHIIHLGISLHFANRGNKILLHLCILLFIALETIFVHNELDNFFHGFFFIFKDDWSNLFPDFGSIRIFGDGKGGILVYDKFRKSHTGLFDGGIAGCVPFDVFLDGS